MDDWHFATIYNSKVFIILTHIVVGMKWALSKNHLICRMQDESLQSDQGLDSSCSCTEDLCI
jgi:hypothetical protein